MKIIVLVSLCHVVVGLWHQQIGGRFQLLLIVK